MLEMKWTKETAIGAISLLVGAGLIAAPWIFGFASVAAASRNAWIAGAAIGAAAIMTLVAFAEWQEWVNLVLGLWVAASPWALNFHLAIGPMALRYQVALGLVVAALAALELWMRHRAPPRIAA